MQLTGCSNPVIASFVSEKLDVFTFVMASFIGEKLDVFIFC